MIKDKEALFSAAPRKKAKVKIGDSYLEVVEMSVADRIAFVEFNKDADDDLSYAFLISRCCPAMAGTDPEEIRKRLNPTALMDIGVKVMELSTAEKKPLRKKKGSPTG